VTHLGPGFHRGVSKADYLSDPCAVPSLSSSLASLIVQRSPAHAFAAHPKLGKHRSDPTAAMVNGTIIDSLLVGGDTELVESPHEEYRTKEAREWRDAVIASGKQPMKAKELGYARKAADCIRENLAAEGLVLDGEHQVVAVWDVDGVRCRARFDHLKLEQGLIVDLKTADSAAPRQLGGKFVSFGYDIQHAAYVSAVETLMPELAGRVRMVFAMAETEPPYAVNVATLDGQMRALGAWRWGKAVRAWGECLRTRKFPGYPSTEVAAPPWAMSEMEESIAGGSDAPF
jgi:hypothetical protein